MDPGDRGGIACGCSAGGLYQVVKLPVPLGAGVVQVVQLLVQPPGECGGGLGSAPRSRACVARLRGWCSCSCHMAMSKSGRAWWVNHRAGAWVTRWKSGSAASAASSSQASICSAVGSAGMDGVPAVWNHSASASGVWCRAWFQNRCSSWSRSAASKVDEGLQPGKGALGRGVGGGAGAAAGCPSHAVPASATLQGGKRARSGVVVAAGPGARAGLATARAAAATSIVDLR